MPRRTSPVMALSFLCRLVRRTIELLGVHRLSGIEKDVEIIVLRHQLTVLQRHTPRPRFTWAVRTVRGVVRSVRHLGMEPAGHRYTQIRVHR